MGNNQDLIAGFLPQIFNINPTFDYHNVNNNIKEKGLKDQLKSQNQPLFQYLDNHEKKIEIEERTKLWFIELKKINSQINTQFNVTTTHNNNDQFTTNFKTCMKKFWDRIVLETDYINKFESKKEKMH
ncbi:21711_t:CDS:2 [Entrophospora sp. SA101]|nr:21711_t:CDS:2 [Entrophospora sp. SA101]